MSVLRSLRAARDRFADGLDKATLDAHQPVGGDPTDWPICAGLHPDTVPLWPCPEWTAANTRRVARRRAANQPANYPTDPSR